jgi:hypothetical protein
MDRGYNICFQIFSVLNKNYSHPIIIEGQLQIFQRKLVLNNVANGFAALDYYENGSICFQIFSVLNKNYSSCPNTTKENKKYG